MRIAPGITAMNPMDLYHMPYTHSLLGAGLWGLLFGLIVWAATRRREAAIGAAIVVVSHWFIDLLVHIPDLTLFGAPPKIGLGLWNHPLVAMPLEVALVGGALAYYASRTRDPAGNSRLWALAALLALVQAINWFGPQESAIRSPSRDDALRLCAPVARRLVGGTDPRAAFPQLRRRLWSGAGDIGVCSYRAGPAKGAP